MPKNAKDAVTEATVESTANSLSGPMTTRGRTKNLGSISRFSAQKV